jgi:hypothetical protein
LYEKEEEQTSRSSRRFSSSVISAGCESPEAFTAGCESLEAPSASCESLQAKYLLQLLPSSSLAA